MRFRKKPVEVEAFEFLPRWGKMGVPIANEWAKIPSWFTQAELNDEVHIWGDDEEPYCMIETLEGRMKATSGDWIIRGVKGEIYPCKPDIFALTYEPVSPGGTPPPNHD